jgi:hypothetical protein
MTSYLNQCENCGRQFSGYVNKRFCGDACRKYFSRHNGEPLSKVIRDRNSTAIPDNAGGTEKVRTSSPGAANNLENFAIKKLISVGANVLQRQLVNMMDQSKLPQEVPHTIPLEMTTAETAGELGGTAVDESSVLLSPEFKAFLGNLSFPFKMLVWGKPGDGKSTFCMKLANEIANAFSILYVAGEEALSSYTIKDKQKRSIQPENRTSCIFINRLPVNKEEWKGLLVEAGKKIVFRAIFYDSITKLNITPFYIDAVARDCRISYFNKKISHVFISHAHKDGTDFRGDGSWGHEVDVIIKCEKGVAVTEKNRFGEVGKEFKIY